MIQNFSPGNSFLKRTYIKDALLSLIMINRMIPHVRYSRSSRLKLQPLPNRTELILLLVWRLWLAHSTKGNLNQFWVKLPFLWLPRKLDQEVSYNILEMSFYLWTNVTVLVRQNLVFIRKHHLLMSTHSIR